MSAIRRDFTITCVRKDDEGYWNARITVNGETFNVTRRYGSWMLVHGESLRFVLPHIAEALQARVRPTDRAEAKAREAAREAEKRQAATTAASG